MVWEVRHWCTKDNIWFRLWTLDIMNLNICFQSAWRLSAPSPVNTALFNNCVCILISVLSTPCLNSSSFCVRTRPACIFAWSASGLQKNQSSMTQQISKFKHNLKLNFQFQWQKLQVQRLYYMLQLHKVIYLIWCVHKVKYSQGQFSF